MTTTSDPRISQSGEWFYVSSQIPGAYSSISDGGDLGTGCGPMITRFRSEEAAIYYLRSEDLGRQLSHMTRQRDFHAQESKDLSAKLHAIPRWIRALFAKPEPDTEWEE